MITPQDTRAILSICLMAAFTDGDKHAREREEIKRIAEGLAQAGQQDLNLQALYQDVLMRRVSLPDVSSSLSSPAARQLAYEMAVCVCDADGAQSPPEQAFLNDLRRALGFDAAATQSFDAQASVITNAPLDTPTVTGAAAYAAAAATADTTASTAAVTSTAQATANAAELDQAILNAAILNGALELLPESLSTMAIIPLQMKLVYRIGKAHGYELDSGHIKDFIATVGVGLTSQYLEQAGRKLLGGLLGKMGGGLLRGVGNQAVSSGMSFATTYALGHVAKRYYAGGRTLSTQMLKDAYAGMTREAQGLQSRYLPAMQDKARTLNPASVLAMVRGR